MSQSDLAGEENKAVLRRFFEEAWHRKNPEIADELFSPDYILHDPGNAWISPGPPGIREMVKGRRRWWRRFCDRRGAHARALCRASHPLPPAR
jgi:hypothetical protein